jgi:hypothetical protein
LEKLADRIDGDTMMSFLLHLSTRDEALTATERVRDARTGAAEAVRILSDCIFTALWCLGFG